VRKNKIKGFEIVAILSAIGIIGWLITDFYGGMIINLLSYGILIIPFIILYLISIIETIISLIKKGVKSTRIKLIAHGIVIISIISLNIYHSDLLKSKAVLTAVLKDDLFHYRLVFRENGTVENQINGFMGFSETVYGKYTFEKDLIIFSEKPYDNDFIPDTLLLDKNQNAIFITKNKKGKFETEKVWLNYFEIE
jgi:hypothetical protein